jgi:hypothetical protein
MRSKNPDLWPRSTKKIFHSLNDGAALIHQAFYQNLQILAAGGVPLYTILLLLLKAVSTTLYPIPQEPVSKEIYGTSVMLGTVWEHSDVAHKRASASCIAARGLAGLRTGLQTSWTVLEISKVDSLRIKTGHAFGRAFRAVLEIEQRVR